jgi:hypothetical protein
MISLVALQDTAADAGGAGTNLVGTLLGGAIAWVFFSTCWMIIAKKTSEADRAWWAWVPVLQILLILKLGGKPAWWLLLLFVPVVNFFVLLLACIGAARLRGKGLVTGILATVFPIVGLPLMAAGD